MNKESPGLRNYADKTESALAKRALTKHTLEEKNKIKVTFWNPGVH